MYRREKRTVEVHTAQEQDDQLAMEGAGVLCALFLEKKGLVDEPELIPAAKVRELLEDLT